MAGKGQRQQGRAALIYDSACPVCAGSIAWIRENEAEGAFEMVPCRSEARATRFPSISGDACMRAMQLVLPGGEVLSGDEALPEVLARLRRYRSMGALFRVPGSRLLSRAGYRWFARHRYAIAHLLSPSRRSGREDRIRDR
jgi:predicted DCC family thiol-disulfide oxidoreductase YuxK